MTDTFGAYVVGFESGDKTGKTVQRMVILIDEISPMTPERCRTILGDASKLTGLKLVTIEVRNLVTISREIYGDETIDQKFIYTAENGGTMRVWQNGKEVKVR